MLSTSQKQRVVSDTNLCQHFEKVRAASSAGGLQLHLAGNQHNNA